jgi:hypothetical protein
MGFHRQRLSSLHHPVFRINLKLVIMGGSQHSSMLEDRLLKEEGVAHQ